MKPIKNFAINILKWLLALLGVRTVERDGVFVIVKSPNDKNRVLLVRHGYGTQKWSLPGGGIKQGEFASIAAVREVDDETGIRIVTGKQIGHFSFRIRYGFVLLFESEIMGGKIRMLGDGEEIVECAYFHVDDLPPMYDAQRGMVGWAIWAENHRDKMPFYGHPDRPPIDRYSTRPQ